MAASELDTRLVMRPLRNTERVLKNAAVERLLEKEKALGDKIKFEDILPEVAGVYPRIMKDGEIDAGAWSCGMVAGLIHDVPTVKELIDRSCARPRTSSASGLPVSCATDLDDDLAFRTTCFDVGQSLLGRFEWKGPIHDRRMVPASIRDVISRS